MSAVPSNYSVAAITNLVPAVDNDATHARSAEVEAIGAIITSEDPQVTVEQKMEAISSLRAMGRDSRAMGAQDALTKATWFVSESPFAKSMDAAGARFSSEMISAGRAAQGRDDAPVDPGRANLDALNRRSQQEQTLIAYNMGFSSLDAFKGELQQWSADYATRNPAPAVKVTLSDEARTSLTAKQAAPTAAEQALAALTEPQAGNVMGAAALSILKSAAEAHQARADAKRDDQPANKSRDYAPGQGVSRSI